MLDGVLQVQAGQCFEDRVAALYPVNAAPATEPALIAGFDDRVQRPGHVALLLQLAVDHPVQAGRTGAEHFAGSGDQQIVDVEIGTGLGILDRHRFEAAVAIPSQALVGSDPQAAASVEAQGLHLAARQPG